MAGVIWFVQVVHYPLFRNIAPVEFSEYHRRHLSATGWVVAPGMVLEMVTGIALVVLEPALLAQPFFAAAFGLLLMIWVSTGVVQVPAHRKMRHEGNERRIVNSLVSLNWVRTVGWSVRGVLLAGFVLRQLAP